MELFYTGTFLLFEWVKTFLIFTIIDRIIIRRKVKEIIKNHDTYISSLVVAAFLIILRSHELSFFVFLLWSIVIIIIYIIIGILFRVFVGKND